MDDHSGSNKNVFFILIMLFGPVLSLESRSVNLALETSFLFDPKDIKENATFINKVQNVLDKLKTVLEPSEPVFRGRDEDGDKVLTSFLSQIGSALIKFDNEDIRKFTNDLRDAIYKHASNNSEFDELFEDERLKAFIKNTANIWAETDPMILKVEIAKYITSVDTDAVIELFKILNKVFDSTDEPKFKKLTKKFTKSIKNKNFTKFLTKTIDFVLFKRYKKLNFLLRHIIKDELKKFTDYVSRDYKDRTVINEKYDQRFNLSSLAPSEKYPEEIDLSDKNKSNESNEKTINARKNDENPKTVTIDDLVFDNELNLNVQK